MPKKHLIFICYRRDDAPGYAGRLYDTLVARFGNDQIFRDINAIELGINFVEAIENAVTSCEVLVAVIGRQWLNSPDSNGNRRIDDPEDYVRLEITTALERDIRVIPVLVHGATMPRSIDLPEALKKLTLRNALEVSDARWQFDVDRLVKLFETETIGSDSVSEQLQALLEELEDNERMAAKLGFGGEVFRTEEYVKTRSNRLLAKISSELNSVVKEAYESIYKIQSILRTYENTQTHGARANMQSMSGIPAKQESLPKIHEALKQLKQHLNQ
jgi:hypothetical protein